MSLFDWLFRRGRKTEPDPVAPAPTAPTGRDASASVPAISDRPPHGNVADPIGVASYPPDGWNGEDRSDAGPSGRRRDRSGSVLRPRRNSQSNRLMAVLGMSLL